MALIKEYFSLADKYSREYGDNTIVLLQVGAFFEVYGQISTHSTGTSSSKTENNNISTDKAICIGSRIDDFCVICELAKANKVPGIVMAGFRDYGLDKYLKKLQDAGYTAVVYTQDGINTPPTRSLQGIYSPGTYFSTDVINATSGSVGDKNADRRILSNNTVCLWIEKISRRTTSHQNATTKLIMGMTNIDIYTGRSTIFETESMDTHNPSTYDEIERFISSYKPSEVIIISNLSQRESEDVIQYSNIQCKMIHTIFTDNPVIGTVNGGLSKEEKALRCTKQTYQVEVLNVFFPDGHAKSLEHLFLNYEIATQSLVFLLNFIYEHNPNLVSKIQEPIFENKSERLVLANHSLRQLNIIDDENSSHSRTSRTSSIMSLLDHTITPMGSRAYKYALLHPTFNETILQSEYNITEYMLETTSKNKMDFMNVREKLMHIKDIEKLHRHIILKKITPYHMYGLFYTLRHIREMYTECSRDITLTEYLTRDSGIKNNVVCICTELLELFEKTLKIDMCRDITDHTFDMNIICRGVSTELDKIVDLYNTSVKSLDGIQRILNEFIFSSEKPGANASGISQQCDIEYVKIHETDKLGISLQATKRRTKLLEDKIKRIQNKQITIHIDDQKQCSTFLFDAGSLSYPVASSNNNTIHSQQIYELCASIISARNKMSELISQIYYGFIISLHSYYHDFENMITFISKMDTLQNKCYIARKYNYCKPEIAKYSGGGDSDSITKSFVKTTGLRHSLIERINETDTYILNDISLGCGGGSGGSGGSDNDANKQNSQCDGMLLYGTNAVGKTSLIRAIGISIILAQSGFYVPATTFLYKPYQSLMTRILGNDNLFKGLSTFVVEMTELRLILRMANENTIVLGDELCSGTEIDSAISIFVAGLMHLHKSGSSYIFATHLHEIADYKEIIDMTPRLRLAHMRVFYDRVLDTLVYDRKLQEGAGESMYGLEVCKSLHLPAEFLECANTIRVKYRGISSKTPTASILEDATPSRYNSAKLRRVCEICRVKRGLEVHHLQHQENADVFNYIGNIHKNHTTNLATLCEECHQKIHKDGGQHIKVKTGKGTKIVVKNEK
jgi:DNA mismatch repair protein MutS